LRRTARVASAARACGKSAWSAFFCRRPPAESKDSRRRLFDCGAGVVDDCAAIVGKSLGQACGPLPGGAVVTNCGRPCGHELLNDAAGKRRGHGFCVVLCVCGVVLCKVRGVKSVGLSFFGVKISDGCVITCARFASTFAVAVAGCASANGDRDGEAHQRQQCVEHAVRNLRRSPFQRSREVRAQGAFRTGNRSRRTEENRPLLRIEDSKVDVRGWGADRVKRGVLLFQSGDEDLQELALLGFAQILRVPVFCWDRCVERSEEIAKRHDGETKNCR
jgi:hypothetical protein